VVEIMFGDFLTLTADQWINHAAKFRFMYGGKVELPLVVRTPMGGKRGYAATHSQSIEKHFVGVPHLRVVAASLHHDPYETLADFLAKDDPVLFVEHKLLYPQHLALVEDGRVGAFEASIDRTPGELPSVCLSLVPREDCGLTVVAYGYEALLAAQVIERLGVEEELFCELVVPAQIAPVDYGPIERSVEKTRRLLTVEEGTGGWSWGTEIATVIQRRFFGRLAGPVEVLASKRTVIPGARHLEQEMLVGADQIERAIREALS
jgi:pyruvate/2-oxoglutarate/acetoin dehydrogenase E1 component